MVSPNKLQTDFGWIGVDLDGTLAEYHGWVAPDEIGSPVMPMVALVKGWLAQGIRVKIFTARISNGGEEAKIVRAAIRKWCAKHIGAVLPITNEKDFHCIAIYDDRAVAVEQNTGVILGGNDHQPLPYPND